MADTTKFEKLVEALDLSLLPVEEQEELLLDLNTIIFKSALVRMIESMDEATKEEFGLLMEQEASEDEIEAFLSKKVPGADACVQAAIESMADDILASSDPD